MVADFDDDGIADVLVAGGDLALDRPTQSDLLYLGDGAGGFAERSAAAGLRTAARGRGLAVADVGRDGLLDVLETRMGQAPRLLVNHGAGGDRLHWLELVLRGRGGLRDPCGRSWSSASGRRARHARCHADPTDWRPASTWST